MCRLVPSEFDSISTGARSGPSTSTWIVQPSSVLISGIALLPQRFLRRRLVSVFGPAQGHSAAAGRGFPGRAFQTLREAVSRAPERDFRRVRDGDDDDRRVPA